MHHILGILRKDGYVRHTIYCVCWLKNEKISTRYCFDINSFSRLDFIRTFSLVAVAPQLDLGRTFYAVTSSGYLDFIRTFCHDGT